MIFHISPYFECIFLSWKWWIMIFNHLEMTIGWDGHYHCIIRKLWFGRWEETGQVLQKITFTISLNYSFYIFILPLCFYCDLNKNIWTSCKGQGGDHILCPCLIAIHDRTMLGKKNSTICLCGHEPNDSRLNSYHNSIWQ